MSRPASTLAGGPVRPFQCAADGTPAEAEWRRYFRGYPDELERLASDARHDGPMLRPAGRASTARDWARWYRAHPEELEGAAEPAGASEAAL